MENVKDYNLKETLKISPETTKYRYSVVFQYFDHGKAELICSKIITLNFFTKKEAFKAMNNHLLELHNSLLTNRKKTARTLDFIYKEITWFILEERRSNIYEVGTRQLLMATPFMFKVLKQ